MRQKIQNRYALYGSPQPFTLRLRPALTQKRWAAFRMGAPTLEQVSRKAFSGDDRSDFVA
jgi:hypothetical protein